MSILAILGAAAGLACAADAAGAAKGNLSPAQRAEYAELIRAEIEAGAQMKLLSTLADEHLDRSKSTDATAEKAKWEAERSQELRDRGAQLLTQQNETTKKRLAFETDHAAAAAGLGALGEAKPLSAAELAYVTRIDEILLQVRQEMVRVEEAAKALYSELHTNTTAEAVGNASVLLDLNAKQVRQLQREQAELELRKLEFRAGRN